MNINIAKAIKQFFPNPSMEMVYFEAIANSLDAEADKIDLKTNLPRNDCFCQVFFQWDGFLVIWSLIIFTARYKQLYDDE